MYLELKPEPFEPADILGPGWNFECDQHPKCRRLDFTGKVDSDLVFFDPFQEISGEERYNLIDRSGDTPLGARACRAFWENQGAIPERFKMKENGKPVFIIFDGTTITHLRRGDCSLCIYWNGRWCLTFVRRIDIIGYAVSAVLKKDIVPN